MKLISVWKLQTEGVISLVTSRFLGIELISSKYPRSMRCSVAVCMCWSLIVTAALIAFIVYLTLPKQTRLDIGLNTEWYLQRGDWQAMPEYEIDFLQLPQAYVVIGHSGETYCNQKYACIAEMLEIQQDHLRRELGDIGPNYLVGGNGYVFEGRGANVWSAMVSYWNKKIISIMFIGDYSTDYPDRLQFEHTNILLDTLVEKGVIRRDYILFGQCQLQPLTVGPGRHIMESLGNFSHWNSTNMSECL